MSDNFRSEDGCDRWISENLVLPDYGFYVDVGCAHPDRYSQTHWLRTMGWKGLAIDGDPSYAPEWAHMGLTTFVLAVLADSAVVPFLIEPTNSLVSRVHKEGKKQAARTLYSILREYGVREVDFMSMDIEGMEAAVLRQFLDETWTAPKVMVIEYNSEHKGRDPEVFNVMQDTSYRLRFLTNSNAVFAR